MMTMLVDVFISVFQRCTSSVVRVSLSLFRIDGFTYCITCGYCACRCCAHDNDAIGPFTGPGASQAFIAGLDKERNQELMRTYLLHPPPNFDTTMALAKDEMLVKEFLGTSGTEKRSSQNKPTGKGREEDTSKRAMYNRPPPRKSPPPLMRRPSPPRARRPSPPPMRFTMLNSPGEEV